MNGKDYRSIDPDRFAGRLREAAARAGLSPRELAGRIGTVSPPTVYHWLSGRSIPTLKNLFLLCQVLEVSPDALLGEEELPQETSTSSR